MELHNANFLRLDPTLLVHLLSRSLSHRVTHQFSIILVHFGHIRCQLHSDYLYGLVFELVILHELFIADYCAAGAIARWAALKFCQDSVDFGGLGDLV